MPLENGKKKQGCLGATANEKRGEKGHKVMGIPIFTIGGGKKREETSRADYIMEEKTFFRGYRIEKKSCGTTRFGRRKRDVQNGHVLEKNRSEEGGGGDPCNPCLEKDAPIWAKEKLKNASWQRGKKGGGNRQRQSFST